MDIYCVDNNADTSALADGEIITHDNAVLNIRSRNRGTQSTTISLNDNSKTNLHTTEYAIMYRNCEINDQAELNIRAKKAFFSGNNSISLNVNSAEAQIVSNSNILFLAGTPPFDFKAEEGSKITSNGVVYEAQSDIDYTFQNYNSETAYPLEEVVGEVGKEATDLSWMDGVYGSRTYDSQGSRPQDLDNLIDVKDSAVQYQKVMDAFDELIGDSSYQGINLLSGGNLNVIFDENRSHNLSIQGNDMSSTAIGLTTREWGTKQDVANSISEIKNAMNYLRSEVSRLGTSYQIIQTRQDFTDGMIDILETGADDLVLADMNEESAQYLMLQTRQQLAINSLSLASQAAQSVLKLF